MIDSLITNKTRIKLLIRFFLNKGSTGYLRNLESEFGESTNAIRLELNRFETAGLLVSSVEKNKKVFRANASHPLYSEIHSIVRKSVGLDQLVDKVVHKLGNVLRAYITGNLARGIEYPEIDFVLVGDGIDRDYLVNLIERVQEIITRKINCFILTPDEENAYLSKFPEALLVWESR